ncbi:MAG: oligoendopeptidase F [Acholeplasmatales bacterium]|nr:oligoendopeptidase F [Acholeplasmatales bacterium]
MNWNLKLIYEDKSLFYKDLELIDKLGDEILALKGTLNTFEGFKAYSLKELELDKVISKAYTYASMQYDLNQRDSEAEKDYANIYTKYNNAMAKISWADPELLSVGEEKINEFISKDKSLEPNRQGIKTLFRLNKYVLDEKSEAIIANSNEAFGKFNDLYDKICVVDQKPAKVVLSDGKEVEVNTSNYTHLLRTLKNQEDRQKVFEGFYSYYDNHKATLSTVYDGILSSENALAKSRGYESILDMHLYPNAISKDVYETLVNTAKNNTEPLKRYLNLRKKVLGLKKYHTYDRMQSLATSDKKYSFEEAKKLVIEADKFMGEDFDKKAEYVLSEGRVSVEAKDGKRTGAYSTSTYNEGPFILLNHNGSLNDVFTIAHEAGHSIHTCYSNETQPYQLANYRIFVAEIASTLNEQVLLDYMLKNTTDKNERIVLLEESIDGLVSTFYRQIVFADYEYQAHKLKEEGKPITADALSSIMKDLYMKYYGIDLETEELKKFVWAYIPHMFHTPFYVYQYATSIAASLAIYTNIKNGKKNAFEDYIELLRSGCKDYPVELVKKAGVDLTKADAYLSLINRVDELVTELEKLF